METRVCIHCEEEKPLDDDHFYFRAKRGNYETMCKRCRSQRNSSNRRRNPERNRELKREWYRRNRYREAMRRRRAKEAMTPEEREAARENAKAKHAVYRQRKIDEYLAEHGTTPECACGCGEHVGFDSNGRLRKYAGPNHHVEHMEISRKISERHAQRAEEEDRIPVEVFRAAVRKVKEERGFTWAEMAEAGGWSLNHLKNAMYDKRAKNIGRELGEAFFNRIAGIPTVPSSYMRRKAEKEELRIRRKEAAINRTYYTRSA